MKILYLIHVDIKWIKQRPHFLAEELSKKNNLLAFYAFSFRRKNLCFSKNYFNYFPYLIFPFFFKNYLIRILNSIILKIFFKLVIIIFKPNYIWITSPFQFNFFFYSDQKKIVYDCMDNYQEFFKRKELKKEINNFEKNINSFAKNIFCSSYLLSKRFDKKKCIIINNAFSKDWINNLKIANKNLNKKDLNYKRVCLCYFGTLSHWIDYDLLKKLTKKFKFLKVKLIGPEEYLPSEIKLSNSFDLLKATSHHMIPDLMKDVDILIMPFILNKLTYSVDPVKLYEYILLGKLIIVPYYKELEKFSKFVEFYKSERDFNKILNNAIKSNFKVSYTKNDQKNFARLNSWENRADQINEILKS